jgi:translocator protein
VNAVLPRNWPILVFWIAVVAVIAAVGSWVTLPKIPTWYAGLVKPSFTPPNAVFGPVWTILYVAMAVSAWRVSIAPPSAQRQRALALFVLQLIANAAWSPVFFGFEAPRLGLAVILVLLVGVVATVSAVRRVESLAAWLLVPYLAWVGYASALNAAVAALN